MSSSVQGNIPLPRTLDITTDTEGCARKWSLWKSRWTSYAAVTKLGSEDEDYQLEVFRYCVDDNILELIDKGLSFDAPEDRKKLDKVLEQLDVHFAGAQNEIYDSFKFFTRQQEEGESLRAYINHLKVLAKSCNFGSLENRMIRDRIVCGIRNTSLQKSFLADNSLTLAKCEKLAVSSRGNCT